MPGSEPFVTLTLDDGLRLIEAPAARGSKRAEGGRGVDDRGGYIGVPLRLADGEQVGSLCALVSPSHPLEDEPVRGLLEVMARLLISQFEHLRRERGLRESNERLREIAGTDPLTGLRNRGSFERALRREWSLARRGTHGSYLVIADVDGLKPVNDRGGHIRGDQLLREVGDALREATRETDVLGRIGGDEFAVILVGAGAAGVERFRERLQAALEHGSSALGSPPSLSVGSSPLADATTVGAALEAADLAMYQDKLRRSARDASILD